MKYAAALLVAVVKADAPPYFNEPPFAVSTHPAAAGLIQLDMGSACFNSGINGVTCGPSDEELFADGMKGDADLDLKIQMKGDRFDSYNQKLLQIETAEEPEETAHVQFADGEKGDAPMKLKIQMKGNRFDSYLQELVQLNEDPAAEAPKKAEPVAVLEPEKVHYLDPKIAKSHTTFYNRQ